MAKSTQNGLLTFFAVVLVLVVLFGVLALTGIIPLQQSIAGGGVPTDDGAIVSAGCNQNPSITTAFVDALSSGTAVTLGTSYYKVNGQYIGTTAPSPAVGDKVQILANATTYISKIMPEFTAKCGVNYITGDMYKNTSATVTVYTDAGTSVLSDSTSGGAVNESNMTGSKNWRIKMVGADKKSTGKMLMVAEFCTPANVSSLTLSENGVIIPTVTVPQGYTREGTNNYVSAWELPASVGLVTRDLYLSGAVASNTQCATAGGEPVYLTWFGKQAFVDPTGTFEDGYFSSLNVAKYTQTWDYDFLILG